jgi:hypothetical protein
MYIEPGYSNVFKPLVAAAEAHILKVAGPQWVYCFTPAGKISQLASSMGMQMEPYCVMSKLVTYDPPAKHVIDLSEAEVQGAPV